MQVKALKECFVGGARRREGDEFDYPTRFNPEDKKPLPLPKYLKAIGPPDRIPAAESPKTSKPAGAASPPSPGAPPAGSPGAAGQ